MYLCREVYILFHKNLESMFCIGFRKIGSFNAFLYSLIQSLGNLRETQKQILRTIISKFILKLKTNYNWLLFFFHWYKAKVEKRSAKISFSLNLKTNHLKSRKAQIFSSFKKYLVLLLWLWTDLSLGHRISCDFYLLAICYQLNKRQQNNLFWWRSVHQKWLFTALHNIMINVW